MNLNHHQNNIFHFDPERGIFIFPSCSETMNLTTDPMRLEYSIQGRKQAIDFGQWQKSNTSEPVADIEIFEKEISDTGISVQLFLRESANCWKLQLENRGSQSIVLEKLYLARNARFDASEVSHEIKRDLGFYENGWQSWSLSGFYSAGQKPRRTHFDRLYPGVWAAAGTPTTRQKGKFACDFYGVLFDRYSRCGWVAGFLSQHEQFGSVEANLGMDTSLNLWANFNGVLLPPGTKQVTDWAVLLEVKGIQENYTKDPLEEYIQMVARENRARVPGSVPAGWCSWYHFYQKVTQEDIRRNLVAARENRDHWPLELIQIDDGFEAYVGDWHLFHDRFPEGVSGLAEDIRKAGFMAGIWLAPFIFQPRSEICRMHPDWMIQDQKGHPRLAGFNWNSRTTALDLTHPEAQDWLRKTIQRATDDWGFPYLKLDFLYAGGLGGQRKDPTKTNAQALMIGLRMIREEAGDDAFLLGCGCPIGSGVGIFDAMRISADTAPSWGAHYFGRSIPFLDEPHAPAARNALHNVLTRANLNRKWWWNDPDCILLRPDSELSLPEVQTAASIISLTGGMLLVSDDLQALPAERQKILSQMLPPIPTSGIVLDWLDQHEPETILWRGQDFDGEYAMLGLVNWGKRPKDMVFSPQKFGLDGSYWLSCFWDGQVMQKSTNQEWRFDNVPAHGTMLAAVRKAVKTRPIQYIGGTLHISQGGETKRLNWDENGFRLEVDLPRRWEGEIRLWIKDGVKDIGSGNAKIENWSLNHQILRINLQGESTCLVTGFW